MYIIVLQHQLFSISYEQKVIIVIITNSTINIAACIIIYIITQKHICCHTGVVHWTDIVNNKKFVIRFELFVGQPTEENLAVIKQVKFHSTFL